MRSRPKYQIQIINDNRSPRLFGKLPLGVTTTNLFSKREDGSYWVDGIITIRRRIPKFVSECKRQGIMHSSMITSSTLKSVLESTFAVNVDARKEIILEITVIRINDISQEFSVIVKIQNLVMSDDYVQPVIDLVDRFWASYIAPYESQWKSFLRKHKTTDFKYWTRKRK